MTLDEIQREQERTGAALRGAEAVAPRARIAERAAAVRDAQERARAHAAAPEERLGTHARVDARAPPTKNAPLAPASLPPEAVH